MYQVFFKIRSSFVLKLYNSNHIPYNLNFSVVRPDCDPFSSDSRVLNEFANKLVQNLLYL